MPERKTLDEHRHYLQEIVKLSLWIVADWKNKNPKEDIIWTIQNRTPLLNQTTFNPCHLLSSPSEENKEWLLMRLTLRDLYEKNSEPTIFEERGYELLEPYISGRVETDMECYHEECEEDEDESWIRYDLTQKEEFLEIHMQNSRYPHSFMSDKKYFYDKLTIALDDAEKHGFKGLRTYSWLNDQKTWHNLMPKEWNDSICDRSWDITWELGFWGQFLTSNNCFNNKAAQKLRGNGKVPFPMSRAQATIEAFRELIKSISL